MSTTGFADLVGRQAWVTSAGPGLVDFHALVENFASTVLYVKVQFFVFPVPINGLFESPAMPLAPGETVEVVVPGVNYPPGKFEVVVNALYSVSPAGPFTQNQDNKRFDIEVD